MIFVVVNRINKHTVKINNQCMYTQIVIKKFHSYIKIFSPLKDKNDEFVII